VAVGARRSHCANGDHSRHNGGRANPTHDDLLSLGRIGFEGRYDYGALGPVTNLASRLSTSAAPGQILIGQRVFGAVEERSTRLPLASSI
jgi:hypothetical protein